jgi:hypothetical protein
MQRNDVWSGGDTTPHILISALDGGEWSASWSGHFASADRALVTHWTGSWLGRRAGLDVVEARKVSCPDRNRTRHFGCLLRSSVILVSYPSPSMYSSMIHGFFIYGFCYFIYVIVIDFHLFPIKIQTNHTTDITLRKVRNWSTFIQLTSSNVLLRNF